MLEDNRQHSTSRIEKAMEIIAQNNEPGVPMASIPIIHPIDVPPSLYPLLEEQSFLSRELGLKKDSQKSRLVDNFIIEKMRLERLKINQTAYRNFLSKMIEEQELTSDYEGELIIDKLYNHILSSKIKSRDYLALFNILVREKRNV